jgi:SSS family solute:Na+ symporter
VLSDLITVTFLTPPDDEEVLKAFHAKIRPIGNGWRAIVGDEGVNTEDSISAPMLGWFLGCILVYGALFGTGMLLYGEMVTGLFLFAVSAGSAYWMFKILPKIQFMD